MLNKQTSSRRNLWKLGLVLPALALFMYSFNIKEVIEYREVSVNAESAFAKAETSPEKKEDFYINAETTASQLDAIENHFATQYPEKRIKFDNRVFYKNGYIRQFSFQTKFTSEKRFFTRFEVTSPINEDWPGYLITNTDDASIQVKELGNEGVTFKITKENLVFNDDTLKINPESFINDETSSSDNLLTTNTNLTDETQQLQQSLQNNTKATSEHTQSLTSRLQDATNNSIKKANSTSKSQQLAEAIKKEKEAFRTQRSSDKNSSPSKFKIRITKNTTDQELEKIKKDLKEKYEVEMDYVVGRNNKKEITSLKIEYTTVKNNSGRYSVNSDDPITDIYIFEDEDGATGIGNAGAQKEVRERMEERQELMQERMEKMQEVQEERQEALKERRQEIEEKREEIRSLQNNQGKESQERLEKMEERMLEQKKHIAERKEEIKMHQKEMKEQMHERKEEMKTRQKEMKKHLSQLRSQQSDDWDQSDSESITITKNTTDDQIRSISSELKSQGITFSLTKVKRNSRGEITGYKMKFNDNNGTESISQKKTNSDSPIETLHIVYNDGNIQVHN